MAYETIIYEKQKGIGLITLNRPHRLNALSSQLIGEMQQVLNEIERDGEVRVIVITGAPRPDGRPCFSAGADLKEMVEGRPGRSGGGTRTILDAVEGLVARGELTIVQNVCDKLEALGKPSIAAVDGVCTAGGGELALSCDMRVVSETAQISDLHMKNLGSIGGAGVTVRLARTVGTAKAKEIMFTGEPIDGREAWRIGWAIRVFPPDKLLEGAKELARKIATMRPDALRMCKASIDAAIEMDKAQALRYSYLCRATLPPVKEGARAFVEKRKPEWLA